MFSLFLWGPAVGVGGLSSGLRDPQLTEGLALAGPSVGAHTSAPGERAGVQCSSSRISVLEGAGPRRGAPALVVL